MNVLPEPPKGSSTIPFVWVTNVRCWAHTLRKFIQALNSLTPSEQQGSMAQKGL